MNFADASAMDDAEVFTRLMSGQNRAEPQGDERRRSIRHPLGTVGIVLPENPEENNPSMQVLVFNVSIHGAGFRSPTAYEVGAKHRLKIGNGPLFLAAKLKVVSSRV